MDVQIFRINDGGGSNMIGVVHLETWYKFPPGDAAREWVRAGLTTSEPRRPGRYMAVAPGSESGMTPCATTFTVSYPEFMLTREPVSREPADYRLELFFEGSDTPMHAKSRDGRLCSTATP